ncbi:glycosyltransferase family 4 protein [Bradyrhizobium diazoefficiens]|uniref:Putative glucosyll transferase n=2 Tax=Nitrobacteraceae TaxID=41294 RepID=A0A837CBT0_9BRAD|nr:glycosyltransferase family 4 protein [Bradyrhizobium diazoefficiens]KGJ66766.1 putative glucosyll transferase [Bradyrhizobium diazoefficiens SEMIA 5080]MDC8023883.1 glycosyltransferase family 4 protein [Bradyrhizobium diazoefficiens]MDK4226569.1 glycosyltransferase family 4 protein [Bradyrhizobium diazoefficiens]PDT56630.1 glycosyltransferase family 1 protein [Bradyrhizobium diazoefficiens]QIO97648.1 glycosyltransferase family 4 protein [Bradyrhizobium diazoefficiens]
MSSLVRCRAQADKAGVSETRPIEKVAGPLQVVIFTPASTGGQGGIVRMMDELRCALQVNRFANIKVCFVTTRGPGSILWSPLYLAQAIVRVMLLRLFGRADVVHINLSAFGSTYRKLILARISRICRLPYVLHLHSDQFDQFWDSRGSILKKEVDLMFLRSQKIIVLGNYWKQVVSDRVPDCSAKIVIVPNATRTADFKDQDIMKQAANILFLGRLGPRKGVPELVRALARLGAKSGWRATLAGDGAVSDTRAAVERAGLGDRISVPGWVGAAQVEALLCAANIVVLPSFSENLPMSVIEALAHGVAVVCTPVGALPDLIEHERTGLIVEPGDVEGLASALGRLIDDPELRQRLGENGRTLHRTRLAIESCAERLVALWTESVHPGER